MTVGEKIEANANFVKWCVHVLGPDDMVPAPSHDAAVARANEINKATFGRRGPDDVLCFAYAAPWPYSDDEHAASIADETQKQD